MWKTPDYERIVSCVCVLRFKTCIKNSFDEGIKPYCAFGFSSFDRYYAKSIMAQNKYILKTTLFARKTYSFILSCDHDNIETVLLSRYFDIDNIVTSL